MIFLLISIVVPISLFFVVPQLLQHVTNKQPQYQSILLLACVLFFISWYLPSPLIDGKDTAFTTHLVGGGIFSGVLWLYLKKNLHLNAHALIEFASLFAFTCSLGVINELFELAVIRTGLARLSLTDTSWDLAANTLGMLIFYAIHTALQALSASKK